MGNSLPTPVVTRVYERGSRTNFRVGCCSLNGYRSGMEDAEIIFLSEKWAFFGVFDGHGGDGCSAFLRKEWAERLLAEEMPMSDARLQEVALSIDDKFCSTIKPLSSSTTTETGDGGGERDESGSTGTFILAEIKPNQKIVSLTIGNIGDSRVLACRSGQPLSLTVDHKPQNVSEANRITECGGTVDGNRVDGALAVSRAFGDREFKDGPGDRIHQKVIALADITHCDLALGSSSSPQSADFALLACDGVFEGTFSNEEVIAFAQEELLQSSNITSSTSRTPATADLAEVAGNICEEAISRGSKDNITCMIVQFWEAGTGGDTMYHHGDIECCPGHWSSPDSAAFRKAYQAMAVRGNLTVGQCLSKRHHNLLAKGATDRSPDEETELAIFESILREQHQTRGEGERERFVECYTKYFESLDLQVTAPNDPYAVLAAKKKQQQQQQVGEEGGGASSAGSMESTAVASSGGRTNDATSRMRSSSIAASTNGEGEEWNGLQSLSPLDKCWNQFKDTDTEAGDLNETGRNLDEEDAIPDRITVSPLPTFQKPRGSSPEDWKKPSVHSSSQMTSSTSSTRAAASFPSSTPKRLAEVKPFPHQLHGNNISAGKPGGGHVSSTTSFPPSRGPPINITPLTTTAIHHSTGSPTTANAPTALNALTSPTSHLAKQPSGPKAKAHQMLLIETRSRAISQRGAVGCGPGVGGGAGLSSGKPPASIVANPSTPKLSGGASNMLPSISGHRGGGGGGKAAFPSPMVKAKRHPSTSPARPVGGTSVK